MRRIPARAYLFIAITCLVAVPFVALGVQDVLGDEPPTVAFYIWALCVLLSLRPIRIATNVELSASEVAVLAGVVLLPPGTLALVAGSARLVNDLVTRKSPIRILQNAAAQAISAGVAAMAFQLVIMSMVDRITGTIGEVIHAVGASLDPNEVFRNVYRQVAAVMDADNFSVATLSPDGATVRYRFLMDGGKELEPVERPKEGTLVGATIECGPLLLKEVERDARRLGMPDLESWGHVVEQSIIVAPQIGRAHV